MLVMDQNCAAGARKLNEAAVKLHKESGLAQDLHTLRCNDWDPPGNTLVLSSVDTAQCTLLNKLLFEIAVASADNQPGTYCVRALSLPTLF